MHYKNSTSFIRSFNKTTLYRSAEEKFMFHTSQKGGVRKINTHTETHGQWRNQNGTKIIKQDINRT